MSAECTPRVLVHVETVTVFRILQVDHYNITLSVSLLVSIVIGATCSEITSIHFPNILVSFGFLCNKRILITWIHSVERES